MQLMQNLDHKSIDSQLSPRKKSILSSIGDNSGCRYGEIAKKLGIQNALIKWCIFARKFVGSRIGFDEQINK